MRCSKKRLLTCSKKGVGDQLQPGCLAEYIMNDAGGFHNSQDISQHRYQSLQISVSTSTDTCGQFQAASLLSWGWVGVVKIKLKANLSSTGT